MRFKEKLTLTLRGYRMLHQLVPGAMLWAFVQNLVRALTPFLNVYLSADISFLAQGAHCGIFCGWWGSRSRSMRC